MTVPTQTTAPQSVVTSYWLYIVGAALGIVGLIITLVTLPAAIATLQAQLGASSSASGASAAAGILIGSAVLGAVLSVAFAVVMVIFARRMRAGRNWARIVLAVLAALQIFGVAGSYGVGALHFLVLLAALIFSFLPTSNPYFRSPAAAAPGTF